MSLWKANELFAFIESLNLLQRGMKMLNNAGNYDNGIIWWSHEANDNDEMSFFLIEKLKKLVKMKKQENSPEWMVFLEFEFWKAAQYASMTLKTSASSS